MEALRIKFGKKVRCRWLKERALYQSTNQRAELKLLHHLPNCTMSNLFRDLSLAFLRYFKL